MTFAFGMAATRFGFQPNDMSRRRRLSQFAALVAGKHGPATIGTAKRRGIAVA